MFRLEQRAKNEIVERFAHEYCTVHESKKYTDTETKQALSQAIQDLPYKDTEFVKALGQKLYHKYNDKYYLTLY